MNYYNRHSKDSKKTMIECMRLDKYEKPCNGIDFDLLQNQWLLDDKTSIRNVRLRCRKCGKVQVRAFDIKSFNEQFNL